MDERKTLLVAGCPGAGKTSTLLAMVEDELTEGTPPDKIGFLTFTKAARNEASGRACAKFQLSEKDLPYFTTLHALGFRQAGLRAEQVLDKRHFPALSDHLGVLVTGEESSREGMVTTQNRGDRLLFHVNLARNRGLVVREHYESIREDFTWPELQRFWAGLRSFKDEHDLFDYADMLEMLATSSPLPELQVLFADEAQDLSRLAWRALTRLAQSAERVTVAGDDDQAIFKWAGADPQAFIDLPARVHVLEQSYRVPRAVQHVAAGLSRRLNSRRDKTWRPRAAEGAVHRHADAWQVDMSEGEWLVLARNSYMLTALQGSLRARGLLYERYGRPSIPANLLSAIQSWERLRGGAEILTSDAVELYDLMSAGRGYERGRKAALERLATADEDSITVSAATLRRDHGLLANGIWHEAFDRVPLETREYLIAALRRNERVRGKPRIRLSTIHGAKGTEADNVVLLTDMAKKPFDGMRANPDDETRVYYVGVTRARETLHLVAPRTRHCFDI